MTGLVHQSSRPAQASQPSRAQQVSAALAQSRDKLEAPFKRIPEADALRHPLHHETLWATGSPRTLETAKAWLDQAGDRKAAQALHDELHKAMTAPPDRASASVTLGLLIDAYPNTGKDLRESYFATMLHDVLDEGVGPYLLAEVCRIVRRKERFAPTIAELLGALGRIKNDLACAVERAARFLDCFSRCEAVVAAHSQPLEDWTEELWTQAVMAWGQCSYAVVWSDHLGPPPDHPDTLVPPSVIEAYRARINVGWGERRLAA